MAREERPATTSDRAGEHSREGVQSREYPTSGFHPIDKWSKILLVLIVVFSLIIFAPVFLNRELSVMGAPWLFYAFPISILTLSSIWLVLTYTVVD